MRIWLAGVTALAIHASSGCCESCPSASSPAPGEDAWEKELDAKSRLSLNPSGAITIKRDVHNLEIDLPAGRFATAFHDVMRDPNRKYGLIKVDRKRQN